MRRTVGKKNSDFQKIGYAQQKSEACAVVLANVRTSRDPVAQLGTASGQTRVDETWKPGYARWSSVISRNTFGSRLMTS